MEVLAENTPDANCNPNSIKDIDKLVELKGMLEMLQIKAELQPA
jgi:hypothetical protein